MQSLFYSTPGLCIALSIGVLGNVLIGYLVYTYSYAQVEYIIAFAPVVWGIILGFGIPYFSNILPIKKALSKTIRDAIDVFHEQVNDVTVKVVKLKSMGISPF